MTTYSVSIGDRSPVQIDEIIQRRDSIPYHYTKYEENLTWVTVDLFGHVHRWVEVDGKWTLPSLVETMVPCDGACGDPGHEVTEWHCAYCDIEVKPQWTGHSASDSIPGLKEITIKFTSPWMKLANARDRVEGVTIYRDGQPNLSGHGYVMGGEMHTVNGKRVLDVEMRFVPAPESVATP